MHTCCLLTVSRTIPCISEGVCPTPPTPPTSPQRQTWGDLPNPTPQDADPPWRQPPHPCRSPPLKADHPPPTLDADPPWSQTPLPLWRQTRPCRSPTEGRPPPPHPGCTGETGTTHSTLFKKSGLVRKARKNNMTPKIQLNLCRVTSEHKAAKRMKVKGLDMNVNCALLNATH